MYNVAMCAPRLEIIRIGMHREPPLDHTNRRHHTTEMRHYTENSSMAGWGAVLITYDNRMLISYGPWAPRNQFEINAMEGFALRKALDLTDTLEPCVLHVFIDNTTLLHVLTTRRSRSLALSIALKLIWEKLENSLVTHTSLRYVDSLANLADYPSRVFCQ